MLLDTPTILSKVFIMRTGAKSLKMQASSIRLWSVASENPLMVRYWDGKEYSQPMSVELAQLRELEELNRRGGRLDQLTFRVGFLALLALTSALLGLALAIVLTDALLSLI